MAELSIISLKITCEDDWLDQYIKTYGDGINVSPNYQFLIGNSVPLKNWFSFRQLDWRVRAKELLDLYFDIRQNGQKEPIKIYKDCRINTGHKRAAVLFSLGEGTIKYQVVPDDYKL